MFGFNVRKSVGKSFCITLFSLVLLALSPLCRTEAQNNGDGEDYVYLLNADEIRYSQLTNPDAQLLIGNVVFRHDSMYMYCDSALFYQKANSFNAYNNVRAEQGDTLFMFGDSLLYDGTERIAHIRSNVRLENRDMILLTDSMNYDRNTNLGYFFNGGTLLDADNTLTSQYGEYDTDLGVAVFKQEVLLENSEYTMNTDTLVYDANTRIAYFVCPTHIVNDEYVIDTRLGSLNTLTHNSLLRERSVVSYSENEQQLTGDSIVYDDTGGLMTCYGNVVMNDFADKIDVLGDYLFYDRERDSSVVTGNALAIEYSAGDSLFLHADTFKLRTIRDDKDSVLNRQINAYHKVKAYRVDLQMICDSLEYQSVDSCITLYGDPVLWSMRQQILGEMIKAYVNDSTIEWAHIIGQALSVEQVDEERFNQISGREMKAFFKDGDIDKATVDGNVIALYYPFDSDSIMIGMNKTEASQMMVHFRERKVHKIVIHEKSEGTLYPLDQIPPGMDKLSNFSWFDNLRPTDRDDVFIWRGKNESEKLQENVISHDVPLPKLPDVVGKK